MNEEDKNSRMYKIAAGKGVMNLPNKLTISRVIMIPVFVFFFLSRFYCALFCCTFRFRYCRFDGFV